MALDVVALDVVALDVVALDVVALDVVTLDVVALDVVVGINGLLAFPGPPIGDTVAAALEADSKKECSWAAIEFSSSASADEML